MIRQLPQSATQTVYFPLTGGEEMDAPAITVDPGKLAFSRNYECDIYGRYRRVDGYEAFDGRAAPSDASYWILHFDAGNAAMSVGDTVTGGTSSAFGELIAQILESGSYAGSDAAGYLVLSGVSGTFQNNEALRVSAVTEATADGLAVESSAVTDALHNTYLHAAIEAARDKIAAVPGSGSILGVWSLKGIKYAIRNNAGDTAAEMYKATTAGWSLCDLGRAVSFTSGGTYQILENDVITGATSGAIATVKRVILTGGTWAGGDAAGRLILYSQVNTFQSENLNVGANLNVATIGANSTANTLVKSGRFEFCNTNFYGSSATIRMYGCDGVSKAFEWDGSVFVPIITGMTVDKPVHIQAHKNHLFLAFPGGSLQHSSIGNPYEWSSITGAAEIGASDEITGLEVMAGPVLAIWTRNAIKFLYGSAASGGDPWVMKDYSLESGAIEWTIQKIGPGIYLDDRGLTTLTTTQSFGDFKDAVISKPVQRFLSEMAPLVQSSIRVKEKNQYRLFFSDMQGITLTISNGKVLGFTRTMYDHLPVCCASGESTTGEEELFFGSTDGFVYQLDQGNSFNGGPIKALVRLHYNNLKSPSIRKRIRKLALEADAPVGTTVYTQVSFDYGMGENTSETMALVNDQQVFDLITSGGIFGLSAWAGFVWDSPVIDTAEIKVSGSGVNFSCLFWSESTYSGPHSLQGLTVHYDTRSLKR